jgi:uncharacterized tellurite resistance protein B-like protein
LTTNTLVLKSLSNLLEGLTQRHGGAEEQDRQHSIRVATALLLVEVARADYEETLLEDEAVLNLIKNFFELSDEEAKLVIEQARAEADHSASLQDFTRRLHQDLTLEEKHDVVEMLWKVALADDKLDKHEDYLVRKVAGLLYVSHSDLIRIRNKVKQL